MDSIINTNIQLIFRCNI